MSRFRKFLDTKSFSFRLWVYFGGFALIIMLILWLFEILLLNTMYEKMKIHEIVSIGNALVSEYGNDDFDEYLHNVAFKNGIIALLIDEDGRPIVSEEIHFSSRMSLGNPREFHEFLKVMRASDERTVTYRPDFEKGIHSVIFGSELSCNEEKCVYLYVSSPLAPVGATQQVLQNLLLIVTILSLIAAFVLSYFIAKKFSKPLTKLSASATELAKGNYSVVFDEGGYTEIDRLATSLNNMTEELSKTDMLRRDLIANVSHDLRTPLTIIKSYAEMIRDISGENPQKRQQHTGVIIDETDRLSRLVSDLLDLSKLEAGTAELSLSRFRLSETVAGILHGFQVLSELEGYHFSSELEEDSFIIADERRTEQAVYNLISNAVQYTGEDKSVSVTVKKEDGNILFSVRDTGAGLSDEEQERIWERYYKSSRTHCRSNKGSGIGLSIVKNVLEAHKAHYGIHSRPGCGSEFWFSLPYSAEETVSKK